MPAPRLPTRNSDAWECGFLFDSAQDVRSVSCRGGLVVAGGSELHLVRPGAQRMASRARPLDIGPIRAVAAEPRAPFRYAVAGDDLVAVFFRNEAGDQVMRLRCTPHDGGSTPGPNSPSATHLAWGRDGAASALYILWSDGAVVRMKQDMSGVDTTDLPPMDAIAADDAGVLAMLSLAAPCAYVTDDGENLDLRAIAREIVPEGDRERSPASLRTARERSATYLAVAGGAVAFAVGQGGVFVSRAPERPFVPCEPLATAGPIAFEGPSSDAALFGAAHQPAFSSIVRVDLDGIALRIADFGTEAGPAPELTGLAWDASRQMVWGASPQMGLVTCTAPSAKGGKKAALS
jgi:hypothetical protein